MPQRQCAQGPERALVLTLKLIQSESAQFKLADAKDQTRNPRWEPIYLL